MALQLAIHGYGTIVKQALATTGNPRKMKQVQKVVMVFIEENDNKSDKISLHINSQHNFEQKLN